MTEFFPEQEQNFESERQIGLRALIAERLDAEDAEFIDGMDDQAEIIGYVYGRLLEIGEDPDKLLEEFGIIEGEVSSEA